jgi:hypothetical protein
MIVPQLADFFLDPGGTSTPRLCRLADELRGPAYEVDVRDQDVTLVEADGRGQLRISGAPRPRLPAAPPAAISFGALPIGDDVRDRIAGLTGTALADYLGALVGFPAWTRHGEDPIAAGALSYEPPRIVARPAHAGLRSRSPETRGATARTTPRAAPPANDRRGTRPRSASRPRR